MMVPTRVVACIALAICFVAGSATGNPTIDGDYIPPKPGVLRIESPPEAVEFVRNRWYAAHDSGQAAAAKKWSGPKSPCRRSKDCGVSGRRRSDIRFVSERLLLTVAGTQLQVAAEYTFRSLQGERVALAFPFAECTPAATLDSLWCRGPGLQRYDLAATGGDLCWRWEFPDLGAGAYSLDLHYRQPLSEGLGVYILTSGADWSEPIGSASIRVRVPRNGRALFNFPMRPTQGGNHEWAEYEFAARDLRPTKDFVLHWQPYDGAPGLLSGRVVDEAGSPIVRCNLRLTGAKRSTDTDPSGGFSFSGFPAGVHDVQAWHPAYGVARGEILVTPGRETVLEITLYKRAD